MSLSEDKWEEMKAVALEWIVKEFIRLERMELPTIPNKDFYRWAKENLNIDESTAADILRTLLKQEIGTLIINKIFEDGKIQFAIKSPFLASPL